MSIDEKIVKKIATLSRITISENEITKLSSELNSIIKWVEQLNEIDTTDVVPMTSNVNNTLYLRKDVISDGNIVDDILSNAPMTEDGFFLVPKVIE
ncbi:Asp-tRNA(Asn)/Glu-tRNA(Gln) amidotransferase subunit GatC [Hyphomicrobiales bacterium]|jgi:aspartyl-tRNA(Asn)/glutamyl-tRNA(Gln) amidotransferase subunit C|nr:Asp-tRNA(Asn)/Glu-tRNA(Gln) amidotransferase subunit GatC [Hyphomicrobiales bacterium]|tara:strand:+ start:324 stop:611 length:288 start_codon:yes stop_codon:yes gene_type:complete